MDGGEQGGRDSVGEPCESWWWTLEQGQKEDGLEVKDSEESLVFGADL